MIRWCCLFTCLTNRALHIEVVRSLDKDSRLLAVNRLIARRDKPTTILSDNGTNFVGSAREMNEYFNSWNHDQITSELAQKHVVWKFNSTEAPQFDWVRERLVKSCKEGMVAILSIRSLIEKVLLTTMCLVEQTLNARPTTSASDDPEAFEALTSNHFILGLANVCVPVVPNAEVFGNHRRMFMPSHVYADMIWKLWVKEYLPQNNVRAQSSISEPNL